MKGERVSGDVPVGGCTQRTLVAMVGLPVGQRAGAQRKVSLAIGLT